MYFYKIDDVLVPSRVGFKAHVRTEWKTQTFSVCAEYKERIGEIIARESGFQKKVSKGKSHVVPNNASSESSDGENLDENIPLAVFK